MTPEEQRGRDYARSLRYQMAAVMDHHKSPLSEVVRMTPAQLHNLAFHPRDDKGVVRPPKSSAEKEWRADARRRAGLTPI